MATAHVLRCDWDGDAMGEDFMRTFSGVLRWASVVLFLAMGLGLLIYAMT
jgi:hypothetical protein